VALDGAGRNALSENDKKYYDQWINQGFMQFVGVCKRFSKQKYKEIKNLSLQEFLEAEQLDFVRTYGMIKMNLNASFKSISKYDKPQPLPDAKAWAVSLDWTKRHFACMGKSVVLSESDVIKDMDKSTSCGYPWNLKYHNKNDMLDSGITVLSDYWESIALPENEIIPIWTCSQKVELRPMSKLISNSVRTFTAAPFEHSCATNRLCLDFNNRFYGVANKTWSFVGETKFSGGWDRLWKRLSFGNPDLLGKSKVRGKNAYSLDESEFDSSLFADAMFGQRDIRWSMLAPEYQTPENKRRLWAVYDSIVHSVIILETGELTRKTTGNPSGSVNTIVDNTMILFRLMAYAYLKLSYEQGVLEPDYNEFMLNVEAALNGDDNLFTTSDELLLWFNPKSIGRVWSDIGVTTTAECNEPTLVEKNTFLSNGFHYDRLLDCWLPVPETEKVINSLMYASGVDDVRWHLLRAFALRIDCYGNVYLRDFLAKYIDFIRNKYRDKLVGTVKGLDMLDIYNVWKTDTWICALYSGNETCVKTTVPSGTLWDSLVCAAEAA